MGRRGFGVLVQRGSGSRTVRGRRGRHLSATVDRTNPTSFLPFTVRLHPFFRPSFLPLTCHNYRVNVRKDFTDFSPPPLFLTRLETGPGKAQAAAAHPSGGVCNYRRRRRPFLGHRRNNCRWTRMGALILPLTSRSPQESNFFSCLDVSNSIIPYQLTGTVLV